MATLAHLKIETIVITNMAMLQAIVHSSSKFACRSVIPTLCNLLFFIACSRGAHCPSP